MAYPEKTSCYDDCPIRHDCFGGYLGSEYNPDLRCCAEMSRIAAKHGLKFSPSMSQGLFFSKEGARRLMLDAGIISEVKSD